MAKKFFIKERHNPQLNKPYYVKEGKLTKKDAKSREKSIYGYNNMLPYDTEEDYENAVSKLISNGFKVH